MEIILKITAAVVHSLYMLLVIDYGFLFFASNRRAARWARPLLYGTLSVHLLYLTLLAVRWQQFPAATLAQGLSLVAFAVTAVYAFVEWRGRETSTGFWMLSLAALFEIPAALLRAEEPPEPAIFKSAFFAAHASLGLFGYAAFVIAAGYAFLFLRLYSEIKRRRFSLFFGKLPPLEVLERLMTVALTGGFAALTASVLLGVVWAERLFDGNWLADPNVAFPIATWLFYGGALLLRWLRHWQGRRMAVLSLAGLAAIVVSLIAVNLFLTDVHSIH